jgi:hypothetical protein
MKKYFIAILMLFPVFAYAQIIDELPKDKNGKLCFSEVVQVPGVTKAELYQKAFQLISDYLIPYYSGNFDMASYYMARLKTTKSELPVFMITSILREDKESSEIIVKAWSNMNYKFLFQKIDNPFLYTIKLQVKDNRYRYKIYDIQYTDMQLLADYIFDKKSFYNKDNKPRGIFLKYKDGTEAIVKVIAETIKQELAKSRPDLNEDTDW